LFDGELDRRKRDVDQQIESDGSGKIQGAQPMNKRFLNSAILRFIF
jgi:hypothetical protein